jgi:hypothetical protein
MDLPVALEVYVATERKCIYFLKSETNSGDQTK